MANTYRDRFAEEAAAIIRATQYRAYAPHCDQMVLHRRGTCWACDGYPDWQQAREVWRINFTGETDPEKTPCPAEEHRPVDVINRWHGNVAETAEQASASWSWHEGMDKQAFSESSADSNDYTPGWRAQVDPAQSPSGIRQWLQAMWNRS